MKNDKKISFKGSNSFFAETCPADIGRKSTTHSEKLPRAVVEVTGPLQIPFNLESIPKPRVFSIFGSLERGGSGVCFFLQE
jgi:hypothetical protein